MNTLFDILKKDRKGTFHWVETVNDIDTAEARLWQFSSEASDGIRSLRSDVCPKTLAALFMRLSEGGVSAFDGENLATYWE
jgi:hypothetical protein